MSTDIQLKGDSRRRQLEASESFANDNGLELVRDFKLEDIGVSAFKGDNVASGALGQFLQAVKDGKIEPGSYLLVESLDRLSRQAVLASLGIFTQILGAGINIVTLGDGHVYDAEKADVQDLIVSLVIMSRAHEESVTKSKRIGAAWSNKRKNAHQKKLTAQCPRWLQLSDDRSQFEIIEGRAAVVRKIFDDCAAGLGSYTIANRLNKDGVQTFGPSNGWQISYVRKILTNRAVLGEFQPHHLVDGKSEPIGDPIPDYYPQIVADELFNRAQLSRSQRRVGAGGRRGKAISNLFSRIAKCAYCGASMRLANKGQPPKGFKYLICEAANRGLDCERTGWRYDDFETSFLAFVTELDLDSLMTENDDAVERANLEGEIQSLDGEIQILKTHRDRTFKLMIGQEGSQEFLAEQLADFERSIAALEAKRNRLRELLNSRLAEVRGFYDSKDKIKALISRLQDPTRDDVVTLRAQIASRLGSLLSGLVVFTEGHRPKLARMAEKFKDPNFLEAFEARRGSIDHQKLSEIAGKSNDERYHRRFFIVTLKDGRFRIVYPNRADPAIFDQQIVADEAGIDQNATLKLLGDPRISAP